MTSQKNFEKYQNTMKTIIQEAKDQNMKVVGVSAQHYSKDPKKTLIRKNNATLKSLADIYIPFGESIDTDNNDKVDKAYISKDGIHANAAGNKVLSDLILKEVFKKAAATVTVDTGVPFINEVDLLLAKPTTKIAIPGVSFTEADKLKKTEDDSGSVYVHSPYLGEYISGIYQFLMAAIGIIAVVMIMNAGLKMVLSGGNSEKVNEAKTKIFRAVVSIAIMALSYTILYTLNPELVNFRNVRVLLIQGEDLPDPEENEAGSLIYESSSRPECKVEPPSWTRTTFDCQKWKAGGYEPEGVVPTTCVVTYRCPGFINRITSIPEMKDAVCKAGELAEERGYRLAAGKTTYRPFEKQAENWCESKYKNVVVRSKFVAVPGKSNHGLGIAIDAYLYTHDKKPLMRGVKSSNQCSVDLEHVEALAKIFYDADPRFERLSSEIWHFNFRLSGGKAANRTLGYPPAAGCK